VLDRLHHAALQVYRRLPVRARRVVVRTLAPSFTVGAICVIERQDGAVLLIRQSYRERWGLPGGLLRRGEPAPEAAVREVREEIGLDVVLQGEPAVVVDPRPQRVDLVFRARVAPGCDPETAAPGSPEIADVRWFGRDDLPDLQHETTTALVTLARSARSPQAVPLPLAAHRA
jgi:8-oxo-dGTP diphosphatase